MKAVRSRFEYFLAKIAGRDVDLNDLTPPVASDTTEELMLEVADRLDNSGGGGADFAYVCNIVIDGYNNVTLADGQTAADLNSAIAEKKLIFARGNYPGYETDPLWLFGVTTSADAEAGTYQADFFAVYNRVVFSLTWYYDDGAGEFQMYSNDGILPAATADDAGKVLTVNRSGQAGWDTLATEEPPEED